MYCHFTTVCSRITRWIVGKMIIEFSAREWEWYMLFDLMRIIESTDFDRLSGNDRRRTE